MKINLSLFILTLSAFTGSFVSADLNTLVTNYGVQSGSINTAGLNEALNLLTASGSYNDDANARAVSAILRAQLSNNTTQADLGNNPQFAALFPNYTAEIAGLFQELVNPATTLVRRAEIANLISVSQWLRTIQGDAYYGSTNPSVSLVADLADSKANGAIASALTAETPFDGNADHPHGSVVRVEGRKAARKILGL